MSTTVNRDDRRQPRIEQSTAHTGQTYLAIANFERLVDLRWLPPSRYLKCPS